MMKKHLCMFALMLILASGCKPLILWRYGIRSPKVETPESILTFARKYRQNPDNIYLFRDSVAYLGFMRDTIYKKAFFSALVFNRNGSLVNYKDSASCQWSAAAYIEKLRSDTSYKTDASRKFSGVFASMIPLSGHGGYEANDNYDYTVVFTWAKFIGKLNDRLFCIHEAALKNTRANIRVISLNVDMQKSWNLRENQKETMN